MSVIAKVLTKQHSVRRLITGTRQTPRHVKRSGLTASILFLSPFLVRDLLIREFVTRSLADDSSLCNAGEKG